MKTPFLTLAATVAAFTFAVPANAQTEVIGTTSTTTSVTAPPVATTTTTITTDTQGNVVAPVAETTVIEPAVTTTVNETVTTTTEEPAIKTLTLAEFDTNNDYKLNMNEVGEQLFFIFDKDGNEVIDNIEFEDNSVLTMRPVDVEKYTFVDFNSDGMVDSSSYTYEAMYQQSGLARFDNDKDGLSPADFLETSFLETDDNKDKTIDLQEFSEVYTTSRAPKNAEQERYRN